MFAAVYGLIWKAKKARPEEENTAGEFMVRIKNIFVAKRYILFGGAELKLSELNKRSVPTCMCQILW